MSLFEDRERFHTYYVLLTPEEANDIPAGHPGYDPDLHCDKYRVISVEKQKQQRLADKKLHNEFVDEPVQEPQRRVWMLIPKTNLCIPIKWFDYDDDAAAFIKALARVTNKAVDCVGRTSMGFTLCVFMDSVMRNRHLRMKKEDDPPHMSLQERRVRHWQAVISESSFARDFTVRLVRHVTLMLVGASYDFAGQNGQRGKGGDLDGKVEKLRDWFMENDPGDLKAFEYLQPKRLKPNAPNAHVWAQSGGKEKPKGDYNSRKRKADAIHPLESFRSKRQCETRPAPTSQRPAPPTQRLDDDIKLPKQMEEGKRGKKAWGKRGKKARGKRA